MQGLKNLRGGRVVLLVAPAFRRASACTENVGLKADAAKALHARVATQTQKVSFFRPLNVAIKTATHKDQLKYLPILPWPGLRERKSGSTSPRLPTSAA